MKQTNLLKFQQKGTSSLFYGIKIVFILSFILILFSVGVYGTTPASVSGKPSIYDNWDTSVYEDGLVAFYRFDNESSVGENDSDVYDWSGMGNNGTITGAVYNLTNKTLGDASMEFNGIVGSEENIVISGNTDFRFNGTGINLTVLFWMKIDINAQATSGASIIDMRDANDDGWAIRLTGDEEVIASVNTVDTSSTTVLRDSTWHHIAVRFNQTNITLFIDSSVDSISPSIATEVINITSAIDLTIGDSSSPGGYELNASLDEMMIFNRSLNTSEISDIYNQQNENKVKAYENMNVISSVTLLNQVYNLIDPETNGAIIMNCNSCNLDCNGATLQGNGTASSRGINVTSRVNVTIKKCIISNYTSGIYMWGSFGDRGQNNTIVNNTISFCDGNIMIGANENYIVTNNTLNECDSSPDSSGIKAFGSASVGIIHNNILDGKGTCSFGIDIDSNHDNVNITNNNISNMDRGIWIQDSDNAYVAHNYIFNSTYDLDFYMVGIGLFSIPTNTKSNDNATIFNNTIVDAGSVGIQIQGNVRFANISDNSIDLVSFDEKATGKFSDIKDAGDTACGITIGSVLKSFISDGSESSSDNITKIHNYTASNITIARNTFTSDVDCLLWIHGNESQLESHTNDLTDYWYRKFRMPVEFIDSFEFYISNNADELQRYCPSCIGEKTVTNNLYFGYGTNSQYSNRKYNYSISKTLMSFKNVNQTTSYNLSLFNLTNATPSNDIYNKTGEKILALNQDTYNITVAPNEEYQVLDGGDCQVGETIPSEDLSITEDTTLCKGTYYLNDTNTNGAIIIGANDITLDCNGASLVGNGTSSSRAVYPDFNLKNLTIKNCNIRNYAYGLYTVTVNDSSFFNNTFDNMSLNGIVLRANYNDQVYDNEFNNSVGTSTAIAIELRGSNHSIYSNVVESWSRAVQSDENITRIKIYNNNFTNQSSNSQGAITLNAGTNNSEIYNNRIINSSQNGITSNGWHTQIYSNHIENFLHHGLDTATDDDLTISGNQSWFNNTITQTNPISVSGWTGIYLSKTAENNVYNNNLTHLINTLSGSIVTGGMSIEGGNFSYSNHIYNNTFNNVSGRCIDIQSFNTTFENNTLTSCGHSEIRVIIPPARFGNITDSKHILLNNIYSDGNTEIKVATLNISLTVNETSTNYHLINLSNDGTIKFSYNGRKDLRVENNTITINNLVSPNDDILNKTNNKIVAVDQTDYTLNVASNEEYLVGDYTGCNAGEVVPYEDISITESTTLCKGTYYLNDSNTNGAIIIGANDITFDGNGASLIGNETSDSRGIQPSVSIHNVTIKNFYLKDFAFGTHSGSAGYAGNITIINNTFINLTSKSIYMYTNTPVNYIINNTFINYKNSDIMVTLLDNLVIRGNNATGNNTNFQFFIFSRGVSHPDSWLIEDNIINSKGGIELKDVKDAIIRNNVFNELDSGTSNRPIGLISSSNISIYNNTFNNNIRSIYGENATDIKILNNTFFNSSASHFIYFKINSSNIIIDNNFFNLTDKAITFESGFNINITNNKLYGLYTGFDSYFTGIYLHSNTSNVLIKNNSINQYGTQGILVSQSENIFIINNTFDQLSLSEKISSGFCVNDVLDYNYCNVRDWWDITNAIGIQQRTKFWDGNSDSNEINTPTLYHFSSSNITVSGNIYDEDTETYLRLEGAVNVTILDDWYTSSSYWFRSFEFSDLQNTTMLYNNPNWNELWSTNDKIGDAVYSKVFQLGYPSSGSGARRFNYSISKTVMSFKNVNQTTSYNLSLFNLTDQSNSAYVQIFNQTSTTPTAENINAFTETIPPNNRTLVFSYNSTDQPFFRDINTTITDININYNSSTYNLTFNMTGTGNLTFKNLSTSSGYLNGFTVYYESNLVTTSTSDIYTTNGSIGNWVLTGTDETPPTLSNFKIFALNGSQDVIGNTSSFNFTNLRIIEYMMINFTLTDTSNISGKIKLYYTANGTNGCSLGNNQSSTCYNQDSGLWIEFINDSTTSTFIDWGATGDYIDCNYVGTSSERNYTCIIDEHYNPNVWKHYPLNFSDIKWQSGINQRIKKNTIWKINVSNLNIPLDAREYKIDFRVNATVGLTPDQALLTYICNTTYTTGNPETSNYCMLVGSVMPSGLTNDGTKAREIFTRNLTSTLGDFGYVLILTDSPASKYYSMKTYKYLGNEPIRTSISNDNGATYTVLAVGYETELNINWFYNGSTTTNATQILFKIYSNDTLANEANSSIQTLTWNYGLSNEPPIVDIIIPEIGTNHSGNIQINWTTAEPEGDRFITNITLHNNTVTAVASNLIDTISNYTFDSTLVGDGNYNLTVESCENETADLYCRNSTHEITIDNTPPSVSIIYPTDALNISSNSIDLNVSASDTRVTSLTYYYIINGTTNTTIIDGNSTFNASDGYYNLTVFVSDNLQNGSDTIYFRLDTTAPSFSNNQTNSTSTTPKINDVIQLNITVTDDIDISSIKLAHNQSGTLTNVTIFNYTGTSDTSITAIFNISITMARGLMKWQIWANDSVNNVNVSQQFTLNIQNTAPNTPLIIYPLDGKNYTNITAINYSSGDADGDSLTYEIYINNTLNTSIVDGNLTQWNASDGYYNLTVTANDGTDSSLNSSSTLFYLDSTAPTITNLINRTIDDGTSIFYTNDNIYLNATITDELIGLDSVIVSWNDTSDNWYNQTVTSTTNIYSFNLTSSNFTNAANKWLGWRYYANDTAGNTQAGTIVNYFVNALPSGVVEEVVGAGASGAAGARGGLGCEQLADEYGMCFYVGLGGECIEGCPSGYDCDSTYRCVLPEGVSVCIRKENLFERLKDKCSYDNLICEDGENPFKDSDCRMDMETLSCKGERCIYNEMWFVKILITLLVVMIMFHKREHNVWIILIVMVLVLNFSNLAAVNNIKKSFLNMAPSEDNPDVYIPQELINDNIYMKYGSKVLPSHPQIGFLIIIFAIYLITKFIFSRLKKI